MNAQALVPESTRTTSHRLQTISKPTKTKDEVCIDTGIKAILFALQVFFDDEVYLPHTEIRCVTEKVDALRTKVTVCGHLTMLRNESTKIYSSCPVKSMVKAFGSSVVLVNANTSASHNSLWIPCPESINSLVPNATGGNQFQMRFMKKGLVVAIYGHPACTSGRWLVGEGSQRRTEVPDLKGLY